MSAKVPISQVYEHVCFYEKEVLDMHKILVGNGNPEQSLVRQVALIAERQTNVLENLKEIKERRKSAPQVIINWASLIIGFAMMVIGYLSLHSGQRDIQASQNEIQAESKIVNEILAPDSTQTSVIIRGNVYIPVLKTDSANIIRGEKMEELADKYLKSQK